MKDLKNWTEVSMGIYRYPIATGCCYEIMVCYQEKGTDISEAGSLLYFTGDWWHKNSKKEFFQRELLKTGSLKECLEFAYSDNKENNK